MRTIPKSWIWTAVAVEIVGLMIDAVWHGLLHPGFEPRTYGEMVWHLSTVHLPLYVGVLGLFVSIAWTVVQRARTSTVGIALPLALAGSAVQLVGEIWHAYSHLRFRPNPAPELIGFVGLAVAVAALIWSGRTGRETGTVARDVHRTQHGR